MKVKRAVKPFRVWRIVTELTWEEVPTNPVPAVAVIQEGRALFVFIGRKGYVGGCSNGI